MRIVYDLRILGDRMHGMARYGLELLRAMLEVGGEMGIAVLVRRPEQAALLPADPRVLGVATNIAPYGVLSQFLLPKVIYDLTPDIYHCPFYAPPVRYLGRTIITVHDLIHLRFPADHGARHRLFHKHVVGPAAAKAQAVFTVSRHSRNDIVDLLGVDPRRVVITPNAAGPVFQPLPPGEKPAAVRSLGWPERYILGVGNPKPHKNLAALVKAHALLKANPPQGLDQVPPLVLVGVGPGEVAGARPGPDLLLVPHLDDADLARAYGAASAVALPSLYEGFGLPALEALACGAPLLASRRASLPEVTGQAALLCEPEPEDLAGELGRLLADQALRQRLVLAGPAQAARFTWRQSAETTLEVYRRILDGPWP